jgi:hypothetical protein
VPEQLLRIKAGDALPWKVEVLQRFLGEYFFHPSDIMYSQWYWKGDELRPWRRSDFEGKSYPNTSEGFTPEGHNNNENSAWTSGLFLWSQCLRFEVTRDEEALAYAAKAFRSLDTIFRLTEARGERGFLCKPYDCMASQQTSPDQYIAAILGLWEYRKIASHTARERIDELLPAMADWWRERNYTLHFFTRDWNILDYGYHYPSMACINYIAYQVSGAPVYRDECRRLLMLAGPWPTRFDVARAQMYATGASNWAAHLHSYEYEPSRRPFLFRNTENRAAMWLTLAPADWLMRHDPGLSDVLKQAIGRFYHAMQFGLRSDLLSLYSIQIDLERDTWYPLRTSPSSASRAASLTNWLFEAYDSEVCWGDAACRIADMAVIGYQHAREFCPGALPLVRALLQRLDSERLHHFIDPDGQQLLPELDWMRYALSSDVPAFTLLAYWRARAHGIALE